MKHACKRAGITVDIDRQLIKTHRSHMKPRPHTACERLKNPKYNQSGPNPRAQAVLTRGLGVRTQSARPKTGVGGVGSAGGFSRIGLPSNICNNYMNSTGTCVTGSSGGIVRRGHITKSKTTRDRDAMVYISPELQQLRQKCILHVKV